MQEKWKKIIGAPRWWLINGVCIALVIAAVVVLWPDDAKGASPRSVSVAAATEPAKPCAPIECEENWPQLKAKRFKKGKLGNAKGYKLPPRVRKMVAKKWHGRVELRDDDPWWHFPSHAMKCLAYTNHFGDCDAAADIQDRVEKKTTKVAVACGGSAIIGFLGGGGWWGLGRGAGVCLWTKFVDLW